MRRRDANYFSAIERQPKRWLRATALLLSFALHLTVLATAARFSMRAPAVAPLIRISLRSGGTGGAAPAGMAVADKRPAEAARSDGPAPKPRRLRAPVRARPRTQPRRAPVPNVPVAPAAARAYDEPSAPAVEDGRGAGTAEPTGTGSGTGPGYGGGSGDDSGSDQRAYCVYCPEPYYPLIARARGWQGTVEVALSVLADGSVNGARLWRSSGHGVLDDAAVSAARHSRFAPPSANGVLTPLRGRIEYRFQLISTR